MTASGGVRLPTRGAAPALDGATGWLNSAPLDSRQLRGKVVLYVFWTYTCINWLRTLPYVRAWAQAYGDLGFVVIGVHTPEFTFEKDIDNVARAVAAQDVGFPIVLDSDYRIWDAFDNHYWPALYLADHRGALRYEHFGEGSYAEAEGAIQQLLRDTGATVDSTLAEPEFRAVEEPADWAQLESPETYLGYARGDGGVSLSEEWTVHADRITADAAAATISVRFHARDLHLVMKPTDPAGSVRFLVRLDGREPGAAQGIDVDASGIGLLTEPRMYQLVRQPGPITHRMAEISFPDGGAEAFVLTFG
jgi:thiol-disulfide isomerase/thioredoxin